MSLCALCNAATPKHGTNNVADNFQRLAPAPLWSSPLHVLCCVAGILSQMLKNWRRSHNTLAPAIAHRAADSDCEACCLTLVCGFRLMDRNRWRRDTRTSSRTTASASSSWMCSSTSAEKTRSKVLLAYGRLVRTPASTTCAGHCSRQCNWQRAVADGTPLSSHQAPERGHTA